MKKDGKVVLKGATKVLSLALAGTLMTSLFTGCGKENTNKAKTKTEVSTNQANDDNQTTGDILFEREDGAILQFLISYNPNIGVSTFKAGYITYDENGVYFDNALTNTTLTLTDPKFEHLELYYTSVASICKEEQLLNGKVSKDIIDEILNRLSIRDAGTKVSIEDKQVFFHSIDTKQLYVSQLVKEAKEGYVYTVGEDEPISTKETTTYSDSEENLTEQLVKTIG